MRNICVFLGLELALNLDSWQMRYLKDESNDEFPYGYNRFDNENYNIKYIRISDKEKKILLNKKILLKLYLYLIKLPIELMRNDIVWTHYDKDAFFIAILRCIPGFNRLLAKQISCMIWLIDESKSIKGIKKRLITKLLNKIDKIIVLAYTEKKLFKEIYNVNESSIEYIRFGINIDNYCKSKSMTTPIEINENEEGYILSIGNDRHRDFNLIISVSERLDNEKFIIATKQNIINYPHNMKIFSCNLKEIRHLYNKCLCVVVPLKYNEYVSGCTTALETAAMKKPVIISRVPGIDDYVVDGVTGIIVPIGDESAIENAIKKLKNNPQLAKEMGENAYNYVKDKFDTRNWANRHIEISNDILGRK